MTLTELRATLSDYDGNPRHGLVGIVLPEMGEKIYQGKTKCDHCGSTISIVNVSDQTIIREFWENYYLIPNNQDCTHYSEEGRYCVLCEWEIFLNDPETFIDMAYEKSHSNLVLKVHYKDIKHDYKWRNE